MSRNPSCLTLSFFSFVPSLSLALSLVRSFATGRYTFALPIRRSRSITKYHHDGEDDDDNDWTMMMALRGGTPRRQTRTRTDPGTHVTLHARQHVTACVDRFLMELGSTRGEPRRLGEPQWLSVSCPRARAGSPFLPARPIVSFASFDRPNRRGDRRARDRLLERGRGSASTG